MKTTNMLSLTSVLIFTIFIMLAIGSSVEFDDGEIERERPQYMGDDYFLEKWKVSDGVNDPNPKEYKTYGRRDSRGRWYGTVRTWLNDEIISVETWKDGNRHGPAWYYTKNVPEPREVYYQNGRRVRSTQSNKSDYVLNGVTTSPEDYFSDNGKISNHTIPRIDVPLLTLKTYQNYMLKYFYQNAGARRWAYYNFIKRLNPPISQGRVSLKRSDLSFPSGITEVSSYEYLRFESPWYLYFIEAVTDLFDSTHVMAFISDIEDYISGAAPQDDIEFSLTYMNAMEEIGENHDIIELHQFIVEIEAYESMKSNPLRLAVLDRYFDPGKSIYDILEEKYPHFLERLNESADSDEIRAFTDYLDSLLDDFEAELDEELDIEDPLFWYTIDFIFLIILGAMIVEEDHQNVTMAVLFIILIEYASKADPVHEAVKATYQPVSVDNDRVEKPGLPEQISLEQNYPNPFNPSTTIGYSIHKQLHTRIQIYDIAGKQVATLLDEMKNPGYYEVKFDASELPSGVYIYRLQAGEFVETKKLVFLK